MDLKLIRERLDNSGLKRTWVAKTIGVHPSTLRRFLNGESEIGIESLSELLKLINVKFEALMKKAS